MHCPNCLESDTKVIETRILQQGLSVRRRRKCESCDKRFTTYEQVNIQMPAIVKADGRREQFNRQKIIKGLAKACQKRPISTEDVEQMVNKVEKRLTEINVKEVRSDTLGNIIMDELYQLDPVSYVRFASFYWSFDDIDSFVMTLQTNAKWPSNRAKYSLGENSELT